MIYCTYNLLNMFRALICPSSGARDCTGLFKMIVGVLTTCHTQYTWDRINVFFHLIEQHSKFLLHTLQMLFENFLIHRCNYILLSQVYWVWQVVKTPTIILNNPVLVSLPHVVCNVYTTMHGHTYIKFTFGKCLKCSLTTTLLIKLQVDVAR